jgi:AraC-like DNA-binding protein
MRPNQRTRPETGQASFAMPRLRSAIEFDSADQVDFHIHETIELCFVKLGQTVIEVAGLALEGKVGTLYVLPRGVRHNQRSPARWKTQCVLFDHDGRYLDERPRALDLSGDDLFQSWMDDLCRLSNQKQHLEDPVADALLFTIVTRVLAIENARQARDALHPSLALAVAFLHEHLTVDVGATELAQAARTSYSHLSALFRAWAGHGPMRHHRKLRMQLARKLLLNPYLSVTEVAHELGYDDTNYFVRLFRRTVGSPPGLWRTNYARDQEGASRSEAVATQHRWR